ncbi:RNA-directed DNA polymerase, eukaryota, partial [Tanacetum coccineum]
TKEAFRDNVGVSSWFSVIRQASLDFNPDGRIMWVEVEGVPLKFAMGEKSVNGNADEGRHGGDGGSANDKSYVNSIDAEAESVSIGRFKKYEASRSGGSFLCLMEEVVKVGQTMGYNMEGVDPRDKAMQWEYFGHVFNNQWHGERMRLEGGLLLEVSLGSDEVVNKRVEVLNSLRNINQLHDMDLAQKAKIKWSIEGDENSRYFHGMLNKKRNQSNIRGIMADGWEQRADLEREVTIEEIKTAVWNCGIDKSPGPDGFTFDFYRHFWPIIDTDVHAAVIHFFKHGDIPGGCNSSFIALIPKIPDANMVKDFRPISLIGSIYKIIAKILTNRLVTVLGNIVSEVHSAFIAGRQILDGPFILNEVLHWCSKKKKKSLIFKVDFEKAYDSVRWDFLEDVLKKFGFGNKWCNWILCCLNSSKGSILVNGSPTEEFQFYKGLKQGDPLSPFLFILVMESLHLSFQRVVDTGMFKGLTLNDSLCLSHMFYADDAIFVGQWSDGNITTLLHVLDCFYHASGLKINLRKSKIMGVNVDYSYVNQAAVKLGCQILDTPFMYLGSIPIFYMSIFKVPSKILQLLESIRGRFFNGYEIGSNKASWVKWNNVMKDKKRGGLGVSSLYALNRGLIA